jgi:hypothetical protein
MDALYRLEGGTGEPPRGDLFRLRTTAAKNVYLRLDDEEKQKIDEERDNPNSYVNPPEVQQK